MSAKPSTAHIKILIIDDDFEIARLTREFLLYSGEYEITHAAQLSEARLYLEKQQFDLILLDYYLPDGNGLVFLEQLRQKANETPVIFVTGQGDEQTAAQAIKTGASEYLIKSSEYITALVPAISRAIESDQLRKSARRSLEQVRYQALLLNNVRDAVVVWDIAGKITFWNNAAQVLFGLSAREMIGQDVNSHYFNLFDPPVKAPRPEDTLSECDRRYFSDLPYDVWVSSRLSMLRDYTAGGTVIGYMDVCRDITPRKEMEAQIRAAQTRLTMTTRLAAIGELAAGVAHQINNPLTSIIADAQILLAELPENHPGRESAASIEAAGWRTHQVVKQLADFSIPDPDKLVLLDVNQTIESALVLVGGNISAGGIEIETQLDRSLHQISGYPHQLQDLWVNLLLYPRQRRFDQENIRIFIRTYSDKDHFIGVEISDNSIPMPKDQLAGFFEPDFSRPTSFRGTGMEMSICQEIARRHQSRLTISTIEHKGLMFRIVFERTHL